MATVSAPGTGSGIDVRSLVDQLVEAESSPTTARLNAREAEFGAEFSAIGKLKAALSAFGTSVDGLSDLATFQSRSVSVGDKDVISVTASDNAPLGSASIEVLELAKAQKLASGGFSGGDATVGSGTLVISGAGTAFSVAVPTTASSLAEIRDAINGAEGNPGVTASLLTVDAAGGGTETRLILNAAVTGTLNELRITVVDDDGLNSDTSGLSALAFDPNGSGTANLDVVAAAADARVLIDNQLLTSQTNSIDFAIEGVTLNLLEVNEGSPTTFSVEKDSDVAIGSIRAFVQSYNSLRSIIGDLTAFDSVTGQGAVFLGDSGVRTITSVLQRELSTRSDAAGSTFRTLSEIGISTQIDGTLAIDESTLQGALETDSASVQGIFSGATGLATRLSSFVSNTAGSSGTLDVRGDALLERLSNLAAQRETLGRRMSARETSLLAKFGAMDSLIAQLQTTSSFLSQQLNALQSGLNSRN